MAFPSPRRGAATWRSPFIADGELSASHTMMLAAPAVGGGALEITRLSAGRVPVKKGDVVIEFDPSEQQYKLEQKPLGVVAGRTGDHQGQGRGSRAQSQDKVALLKAR